jgi:hypothetical protein
MWLAPENRGVLRSNAAWLPRRYPEVTTAGTLREIEGDHPQPVGRRT